MRRPDRLVFSSTGVDGVTGNFKVGEADRSGNGVILTLTCEKARGKLIKTMKSEENEMTNLDRGMMKKDYLITIQSGFSECDIDIVNAKRPLHGQKQ